MLVNTVMNHKGGVTKTTTTMLMGECLASAGYPSLLIDGDPQGTLSIDTYDIDPSSKGLAEVIEDPTILKEVIKPTRVKNLFVIPPGNDLGEVFMRWETRGLLREKTDQLVVRLHEDVGGSFDAAFIDNPPSISGFPQYASELSDKVIIPVESEQYSLMATVRTWIRIKNLYPLWKDQDFAILISKHVEQRSLARDHVRGFNQFVNHERIDFEMHNKGKPFPVKLLNAVIPSSADVANMLYEKSNLFIKKGSSPVAQGYIKAVMELYPQFSDIPDRLKEKRDEQKTKGLFGGAKGKGEAKLVAEGAKG